VGNCLVYVIFNIIGISPDIRLLGLIYSLIGIATSLNIRTYEQIPLFSKVDLVVLAAAITSIMFLIYPVYYNHSKGESYAESTLHLLSSGEDHASHFALFKYAYLHGGYAYSPEINNKGLISTLVNYSQGSEFSSAWIAKSIYPNADITNAKLVELYYLMCVLTYALLIVFICWTSLILYEKTGRNISGMQAGFLIGFSFLLLTIGPLLSLLARGFLSQIFALIFLFAMLLTLGLKSKHIFQNQLLVGLLFWSGVTITWWFLTPIATVVLLFAVYKNRESITNKYIYLLGAFIFLLSVYPILLGELTSTGSG
jgi:hypothetical protein